MLRRLVPDLWGNPVYQSLTLTRGGDTPPSARRIC
jgi:hypothetical protein